MKSEPAPSGDGDEPCTTWRDGELHACCAEKIPTAKSDKTQTDDATEWQDQLFGNAKAAVKAKVVHPSTCPWATLQVTVQLAVIQ